MTLKVRIKRLRESASRAVAWALPRSVAYWCAVRVMSHATAGPYGATVVSELTALEGLDRWDRPAPPPLPVIDAAAFFRP